jgi:hypothetical protein
MNIFKHKLNYGMNYLRLPRASQFLDVQVQNGILNVWTLEPDDTNPTDREILVCFTGEDVDLHTYDVYLGTVQHDSLVYHVFEKL